jgi:hypothetical protein
MTIFGKPGANFCLQVFNSTRFARNIFCDKLDKLAVTKLAHGCSFLNWDPKQQWLRIKDKLEDIRNYNFNFFVRGSVELMAGIHSQNQQFLNLKKPYYFMTWRVWFWVVNCHWKNINRFPKKKVFYLQNHLRF